MSGFRKLKQRIGISGIIFLFGLALFLIFYFTNRGGLAALMVVLDIPFAVIMAFRAFRFITRHSLWSLRNRLLFVYGLIGVLPILLLFVLIGLGVWALMSELAIYLASSALDRSLESIHVSTETIEKLPPEDRRLAVPETIRRLDETFPGITFYIKDATGDHRYPPDRPPLPLPPGWKDVHGLLVVNHDFYAWAHAIDGNGETTAIAPLSNGTLANLVPHLGVIALVETAGHSNLTNPSPSHVKFSVENQDFQLPSNDSSSKANVSPVPPPVNKFDIETAWPSTRSYYELDDPGHTDHAVLWVQSRPSAVLSAFFSGGEILRGVLFDAVIVVAVLFLFVEIVAAAIGISLSRRITRAVNQLYEGTRGVIRGDFAHRIPVRNRDQLGDLADSFNQMTARIENLLIVEKEKERLQTEIEIAREVQGQLYPKGAPPEQGLKLSVRCDPARMVSGDYYDYQVLPDNRLAFAIGDVAGKGISAALLMATLQAALKAQLAHDTPTRDNECSTVPDIDAAEVVSRLNQQLYAHTSPEKYATFFFAVFDETTRTLTYANAGHLPPILIRNGDVRRLDSNGTVVGAFPFAKYEESCITMEPGDLLVCYTDGITEPENAYGEMFGEERLIELVRKHAHDPDEQTVSTVLDAVRSWTGTPELFDDMTLLLARDIQPA